MDNLVKLKMVDEAFNEPDPSIMSVGDLFGWVLAAPGAFHVSEIDKRTDKQRKYIDKLEIMVKTGHLERVGKKRGWYRSRQGELDEMDFINALDEPVNIWLPFELSDKVEIYEGNIIIIAGVPNTGKTALVLNIINENKGRFEISYFNSEMGAGELKKRLDLFPYTSLETWDFKAYSRGDDFADVIKPGVNNLNIIDFLEVHDEFYIVGKRIKEIHDRLDGAIAVICLQKNPGQDAGLGGFRSMEVARLVLALDSGRVKITKAKNYHSEENPNGLMKNFKLVNGCQIIDRHGWYRESKE